MSRDYLNPQRYVADLWDVEVAKNDQVVILGELAGEVIVDPVGQQLQLFATAFGAVAPAGVLGERDEIEVAGPE